jgi:hypothetical protein
MIEAVILHLGSEDDIFVLNQSEIFPLIIIIIFSSIFVWVSF